MFERFFGTSKPIRNRIRKRPAGTYLLHRESLEGRTLLATVAVQVGAYHFSPSVLTIQLGDTVNWIWTNGGHSTTSVAGQAESWDSGVLSPPLNYPHTFTHLGTFNYDSSVSTDVSFTGQITVVPADSMLVSISLTPSSPNIGIGATQQFTATGTFADQSTQDLTSEVAWSSTSPTVATISSTGLATANAAGTSTITASLGNISNATVLTVSEPETPAPPTTPTPAPAPILESEPAIFAGKGHTRTLTGFMLNFSAALDASGADDVAHYQVVQAGKSKGKASVGVPVLSARYDPSNNSVSLLLHKFNAKKPGTLTITGLTGISGTPVATIVRVVK